MKRAVIEVPWLCCIVFQDQVEDQAAWEEEQKRLDREWYGLDEGYDETNNPFSGVSSEYTRLVFTFKTILKCSLVI